MSKYCVQCGKTLNDDDIFCEKCGTKQEIIEAAPLGTIDSSKRCIKCGNKLEDDDLFCGVCGAKQEVEQAHIEYEDVQEAVIPKKQCIKCGCSLDDDDMYCIRCGAKQEVEGLSAEPEDKQEAVAQRRKCIKCGYILEDNDVFCVSCGAKQESSDISIAPNEMPPEIESADISKSVNKPEVVFNQAASQNGKTKRSKKLLILTIGGIAIVCIIALLAIFMFGHTKGLIALDEVEQKLNEAFDKLWGDYADTFEGVTGFEVDAVDDKEAYDHIFCCFAPLFGADATCPIINGRIKNGQVIQLQAQIILTEDLFNQLNVDTQAAMMVMLASPTVIFKDEIDTMNDLTAFLADMEAVNDEVSGPIKLRAIDGDIEYTYMCGYGSGIGGATYTIRYLPAFTNGFFEDDDDEIDNNDSKQGEIGNNPSTEQNALYNAKIDEYRQALTMGSEAFYAKYDYGSDCSSINALMVHYSYNYGGGIYYTIFDIDENGTAELIFSDSNNIIDIYTIHNGTVIKLFEDCYFGERVGLNILTTGRLLVCGSNGAFSDACEMYRIDAVAGKLSEPICAFYCDGNGPDSYMTGYTYMKEDEYYDMVSNWMEESLFEVFEWTLIAENQAPNFSYEEDVSGTGSYEVPLRDGDTLTVSGIVQYSDDPCDVGNEYCYLVNNETVPYYFTDIFGETAQVSDSTFFCVDSDLDILFPYTGRLVTITGTLRTECHGIAFLTNIKKVETIDN